jgi:CDGSH-type Zn-finger protein
MSDEVLIRCRANGPLVVQGPFRIVDHLENEFIPASDKEFVALCRCGASRQKPFCDGSHRTCGFEAAETARASGGITD